jgi:hypothetical protein
MNTQNYTDRLKNIREQMGKYSDVTQPDHVTASFNFSKLLPTFMPIAVIKYVTPPVVIFILLLVFKPSFIKDDYIDQDNMVTSKMNYKKLFIYMLIGGIVIDIGIFAYTKKMLSDKENVA